MTQPRSALVSLETTPYYHCISRCVRRAFLLGHDARGRSFDHRKDWLLARIRLLVRVFAIDVAAYAVMSNHYHLVLHVDRQRALSWSDEEVIKRWSRLYKGPVVLQRYRQGDLLSDEESSQLSALICEWRKQLSNISRFMASLNYAIALRANREDGCTGRFWEGRFKSQALKDEAALLACMAYVDLNPVRAGVAGDLERSDFTSVQQRIQRLSRRGKSSRPSPDLMKFKPSRPCAEARPAIPCRAQDYLELVDWYGRHIRPGKAGHIDQAAPRLLASLALSPQQWHLLEIEVGKEASTMLHGLEKLEVIVRRPARNRAA